MVNEPVNQEDKDDLVQSVENVATVGDYTTQEENGQPEFVAAPAGDKLRLPNDKAKARFSAACP
jgi:hypothetical protein